MKGNLKPGQVEIPYCFVKPNQAQRANRNNPSHIPSQQWQKSASRSFRIAQMHQEDAYRCKNAVDGKATDKKT